MFERGSPDLYGILKEIGCAVGGIVVILQYDPHLGTGLIAVQPRDRRVRLLRHLRGFAGGGFQAFMVKHPEMLRFQNLPLELRVILCLRSGCQQEQQRDERGNPCYTGGRRWLATRARRGSPDRP